MERERSETYNRVVADIAAKLLPVLDNLKRALETEASVEASESDEFRHFLSGVDLIYKQLNGVLDALGLSRFWLKGNSLIRIFMKQSSPNPPTTMNLTPSSRRSCAASGWAISSNTLNEADVNRTPPTPGATASARSRCKPHASWLEAPPRSETRRSPSRWPAKELPQEQRQCYRACDGASSHSRKPSSVEISPTLPHLAHPNGQAAPAAGATTRLRNDDRRIRSNPENQ